MLSEDGKWPRTGEEILSVAIHGKRPAHESQVWFSLRDWHHAGVPDMYKGPQLT